MIHVGSRSTGRPYFKTLLQVGDSELTGDAENGCKCMSKGFVYLVARYLCGISAAVLVFLTLNTHAAVRQAGSFHYLDPQSVVLTALEQKSVVSRTKRPHNYNSSKLDAHPSVNCAQATQDQAKATFFCVTPETCSAPAPLGWEARAPPRPAIPIIN